MKTPPLFSIIIPVRQVNGYVRETLKYLENQSFKSFEVLIITDKISKNPNPAYKRNLGAKMAKGQYLAFLDDDSYPSSNWLRNALSHLRSDISIAAVCGPCLTPPNDNPSQVASGLIWSSWLGSGGAGTYRNSISPPRFVDDFPTVNLIVKKDIFEKVKGFKIKYWPGEDTLFCLDIVNLHQKILYNPQIIVYHHRRSVLLPHLKQISRYALHRGLFARIFPKNSFKIGYLIPSIFVVYLISLPFTHYPLPLVIYLLLLTITFIIFLFKNSFIPSLLAIISIPPTHLIYGVLFIIGYLKKNLKFSAHSVNSSTGEYHGG